MSAGPVVTPRELAEPWLVPIAGSGPEGGDRRDGPGQATSPGADPAGSDPRGSPAYAAILAAFEASRAPGAEAVDWVAVASACDVLLRLRAKDLDVACCFALALFMTERLEGLLRGLAVVSELIDTYGRTCFPRGQGPGLTLMPRLLRALEERIAALEVDEHAFDRLRRGAGRLHDVLQARPGEWAVDVQPALERFSDALARRQPVLHAPGPTPAVQETEQPPHTEERLLEVAFVRHVVEQVEYPLYVLIRLPRTPTLLERLTERGAPDPTLLEEDSSEMWVDFSLSAAGTRRPLRVVVTLKGDGHVCEEPCKRVRLYSGKDAPLLTFRVTARAVGPVSLIVEVELEGDLVAAQQLWRVCVDRTAEPEEPEGSLACKRSLLAAGPAPRRLAGLQSAESSLHGLLMALFSSDALYRWLRLRSAEWSNELPGRDASLNELAFAVIDSGARHAWIDGAFFDALVCEFPRRANAINAVRGLFTPSGAPA